MRTRVDIIFNARQILELERVIDQIVTGLPSILHLCQFIPGKFKIFRNNTFSFLGIFLSTLLYFNGMVEPLHKGKTLHSGKILNLVFIKILLTR